jgi:hypothetical protein
MTSILELPAVRPTAGMYLRKRREAAGLSIDEIALAITRQPPAKDHASAYVARELDAAEREVSILPPGLLVNLRMTFPFDPEIYGFLVANVPTPAICRVCACSWHDPCTHLDGTPCAWAEPDLCTACAVTSRSPAGEIG